MKKNLIFMLLFIVFSTFLVACGSEDNNEESSGDAIEFTFAHNLQTDTPQHEGALKFKELVEEKSDGELLVKISPAAQLGDELEVAQSTQTGAIEGSFISTAVLSNLSPVLQLPDLPFLVKDRETMYTLLDGEVGDDVLETLKDSDLIGTAFWESGFKQITSNIEIEKPEDLKGQQFRTMESDLIMDTYTEMGANAIDIPFPEVYTSLQQGVVDGHENPLSTITSMNFYEVQDYVTIADIAYLGYAVIFNQDWFEGLSDNQQEVLTTSSKEAAEFERQTVEDMEEEFIETIEESGTVVNELTPDQIAEFQDATLSIHEEYESVLGEDLMDKVNKVIEENE